MNKNKREFRRPATPVGTSKPSLFQQLSPAQSRQARRIAYRAALAVIG